MLRPGLSYEVAATLPHGPGFVLLDRLIGYDEEAVVCEVTIRPQSRFCAPGGGVPAWVGVEYMAQAIGVHMGIRRLQRDLPVQVGLLLGARLYDCTLPDFPVGAVLRVRAAELMRDNDGVGVFACELHHQGARIATADIKAFDPDDMDVFLRKLDERTP